MARLVKTKRENIKDKEAMELMDTFEWSYHQALTDLERLELLQQQYDNVIDESTWPTNSQIPIPVQFASVEKVLPDIIEYLFPPSQFVKLMPLESGVDMSVVRNAEIALQHTLITRMKLQRNSFPTIKDCFKLGLGYGIVEPCLVTPDTVIINKLMRGRETLKTDRVITSGKAYKSIRYRYVGPGQIVPYPDGSDFNGHNRVSWSFFLDVYKQGEFAKMFKNQPRDGEAVLLKGNADEIIQEARDIGFLTTSSIVDMMAALAGYDIRKPRDGASENLPVQVPVLKCYSAGRQVWIANGTRVIHRVEEEDETLRCPLVKCSASMDGKRWFIMSTPEATSKMANGVNLWANALFDLMTYRIKPVAVYNKRQIDKAPERGPQSDIAVDGNIDTAFSYVQPPPIDAGLFTIGQELQKWHGDATGQGSAGPTQPGMLRGGVYAFESLLQSTSGRSRLAGVILETGFLEDVAQQTLCIMQGNIDEDGDMLRLREYDTKSGNEYLKELKITQEDIVNSFELSLTLKAKSKNSMIDSQNRLAEWNAFKDSEFIDQYEFLISRFTDEEEARRFVLPRKDVRDMQAENRQVGLAERSAGIRQQQATALNANASAAKTSAELAGATMGGTEAGPTGAGMATP